MGVGKASSGVCVACDVCFSSVLSYIPSPAHANATEQFKAKASWRCNHPMARIAGVDLPREKRVEVALTYIYGIGPNIADDIIAATGVNPDTRVKDLTEERYLQAPRLYRPSPEGRRRSASRSFHEHQAPDGNRLLSWPPSSPRSSRARTEYQAECAYPQGPEEAGCR